MVRAKDILGINARQLLYISKYNSREAADFADDKLKTKKFLEARGVRVPKLYAVMRNQKELDIERIKRLPSDIVVKPNSSSGGDGIIVLGEKIENGWKRMNGKEITFEQIENHIKYIFAGAFSKSGFRDIALIEKRIICHDQLAHLSYKGLPDIRVIVFNLVPIIAMLRLTTKESGGVANMAMGGIGAGIDIAKGEVTHLAQYNSIIHELPGVGPIKGFKVPHWDEVLEMAVKAQHISNLGFLGVDISLDKEGPLLLELNARAGLKIQVANLVPLRKRLKRVEGLRVNSVEKGIRLGKDLFGRKMERDIKSLSGKNVIGDRENVTLYYGKKPVEVLAHMDPLAKDSLIDQSLYEEIIAKYPDIEVEEGKLQMKFSMLEKKGNTIFTVDQLGKGGHKLILGRKELKDCLIDPYKYKRHELPMTLREYQEQTKKVPLQTTIVTNKWKDTDEKLASVEKEMNKAFSLMPLNYEEEMEAFVKANGDYNPTFIYKDCHETFVHLKKSLDEMDITQDTPQGRLFHAKKEELQVKLDMFEHLGKNNEEFTALSKQYFCGHQPNLLKEAQQQQTEYLSHLGNEERDIKSPKVITSIKECLASYGLNNWNIEQKTNAAARVSVAKSKKRIIKVLEQMRVSEEDLKALIPHEIETHVLRLENGFLQPYKIFTNGFAKYIITEEGLAIHNQLRFTEETSMKSFVFAVSYFNNYKIEALDFKDSAIFMLESYNKGQKVTKELLMEIFRKVYRKKRGIGDTSIPGGYARDYIYFTGLKEIEGFVNRGGKLEDLYFGKTSLEALDDVLQMEELQAPKFIPHFYNS